MEENGIEGTEEDDSEEEGTHDAGAVLKRPAASKRPAAADLAQEEEEVEGLQTRDTRETRPSGGFCQNCS